MDLSSQFDGMYMAMNSVNNTSMTQLLGKEVVAVGNQFFIMVKTLKLHYASAGATQVKADRLQRVRICGVFWSPRALKKEKGLLSGMVEESMGNPYQKVITHFPSQALTETVIR